MVEVGRAELRSEHRIACTRRETGHRPAKVACPATLALLAAAVDANARFSLDSRLVQDRESWTLRQLSTEILPSIQADRV